MNNGAKNIVGKNLTGLPKGSAAEDEIFDCQAEAWDQWRMELSAREMEEEQEYGADPEARGTSGLCAGEWDMDEMPEEER